MFEKNSDLKTHIEKSHDLMEASECNVFSIYFALKLNQRVPKQS